MGIFNHKTLMILFLIVVFVHSSTASRHYHYTIPENGDCTHYPHNCASGLDCVGSGRTKRCKKLMPVNGRCETDPFWFCERHLVCERHRCKIPAGSSCPANTDGCASGLSCVDSGSDKKCAKISSAGEQCDNNPFTVCESGLICQDGTCKIQSPGICTNNRHDCAQGLECVGTGSTKRCMKLMGPNGRCETDPFWLCEDNLLCQNNVCKIPAGASCLADSSACAAGTACENGVCKIQFPEICTDNPADCAAGLECVGSGRTKRCMKLMGPNGRCEVDPFWFCERGLTCERHVCKIPESGVCAADPDACASGLSCVSISGTKKCKKLMPVGGRCDPVWPCETGLVCSHGRCLIPENAVCTANPSFCIAGTKCVGRSNYKLCKRPMGPGQSCRNDPFWFCADGFDCIHGRCLLPRGSYCGHYSRYCAYGSKCAIGGDNRCH